VHFSVTQRCTLCEAQEPLQLRRQQVFAAQNHIQVSPINAVVLRKCDLTSLAFYCGSQQMNEVIIAKHKGVPAQTAGEGKCTSFVIGLGRHGLGPTSEDTNTD
jgi:recombinational DNA repair protein RecR